MARSRNKKKSTLTDIAARLSRLKANAAKIDLERMSKRIRLDSAQEALESRFRKKIRVPGGRSEEVSGPAAAAMSNEVIRQVREHKALREARQDEIYNAISDALSLDTLTAPPIDPRNPSSLLVNSVWKIIKAGKKEGMDPHCDTSSLFHTARTMMLTREANESLFQDAIYNAIQSVVNVSPDQSVELQKRAKMQIFAKSTGDEADQPVEDLAALEIANNVAAQLQDYARTDVLAKLGMLSELQIRNAVRAARDEPPFDDPMRALNLNLPPLPAQPATPADQAAYERAVQDAYAEYAKDAMWNLIKAGMNEDLVPAAAAGAIIRRVPRFEDGDSHYFKCIVKATQSATRVLSTYDSEAKASYSESKRLADEIGDAGPDSPWQKSTDKIDAFKQQLDAKLDEHGIDKSSIEPIIQEMKDASTLLARHLFTKDNSVAPDQNLIDATTAAYTTAEQKLKDAIMPLAKATTVSNALLVADIKAMNPTAANIAGQAMTAAEKAGLSKDHQAIVATAAAQSVFELKGDDATKLNLPDVIAAATEVAVQAALAAKSNCDKYNNEHKRAPLSENAINTAIQAAAIHASTTVLMESQKALSRGLDDAGKKAAAIDAAILFDSKDLIESIKRTPIPTPPPEKKPLFDGAPLATYTALTNLPPAQPLITELNGIIQNVKGLNDSFLEDFDTNLASIDDAQTDALLKMQTGRATSLRYTDEDAFDRTGPSGPPPPPGNKIAGANGTFDVHMPKNGVVSISVSPPGFFKTCWMSIKSGRPFSEVGKEAKLATSMELVEMFFLYNKGQDTFHMAEVATSGRVDDYIAALEILNKVKGTGSAYDEAKDPNPDGAKLNKYLSFSDDVIDLYMYHAKPADRRTLQDRLNRIKATVDQNKQEALNLHAPAADTSIPTPPAGAPALDIQKEVDDEVRKKAVLAEAERAATLTAAIGNAATEFKREITVAVGNADTARTTKIDTEVKAATNRFKETIAKATRDATAELNRNINEAYETIDESKDSDVDKDYAKAAAFHKALKEQTDSLNAKIATEHDRHTAELTTIVTAANTAYEAQINLAVNNAEATRVKTVGDVAVAAETKRTNAVVLANAHYVGTHGAPNGAPLVVADAQATALLSRNAAIVAATTQAAEHEAEFAVRRPINRAIVNAARTAATNDKDRIATEMAADVATALDAAEKAKTISSAVKAAQSGARNASAEQAAAESILNACIPRKIEFIEHVDGLEAKRLNAAPDFKDEISQLDGLIARTEILVNQVTDADKKANEQKPTNPDVSRETQKLLAATKESLTKIEEARTELAAAAEEIKQAVTKRAEQLQMDTTDLIAYANSSAEKAIAESKIAETKAESVERHHKELETENTPDKIEAAIANAEQALNQVKTSLRKTIDHADDAKAAAAEAKTHIEKSGKPVSEDMKADITRATANADKAQQAVITAQNAVTQVEKSYQAALKAKTEAGAEERTRNISEAVKATNTAKLKATDAQIDATKILHDGITSRNEFIKSAANFEVELPVVPEFKSKINRLDELKNTVEPLRAQVADAYKKASKENPNPAVMANIQEHLKSIESCLTRIGNARQQLENADADVKQAVTKRTEERDRIISEATKEAKVGRVEAVAAQGNAEKILHSCITRKNEFLEEKRPGGVPNFENEISQLEKLSARIDTLIARTTSAIDKASKLKPSPSDDVMKGMNDRLAIMNESKTIIKDARQQLVTATAEIEQKKEQPISPAEKKDPVATVEAAEKAVDNIDAAYQTAWKNHAAIQEMYNSAMEEKTPAAETAALASQAADILESTKKLNPKIDESRNEIANLKSPDLTDHAKDLVNEAEGLIRKTDDKIEIMEKYVQAMDANAAEKKSAEEAKLAAQENQQPPSPTAQEDQPPKIVDGAGTQSLNVDIDSPRQKAESPNPVNLDDISLNIDESPKQSPVHSDADIDALSDALSDTSPHNQDGYVSELDKLSIKTDTDSEADAASPPESPASVHSEADATSPSPHEATSPTSVNSVDGAASSSQPETESPDSLSHMNAAEKHKLESLQQFTQQQRNNIIKLKENSPATPTSAAAITPLASDAPKSDPTTTDDGKIAFAAITRSGANAASLAAKVNAAIRGDSAQAQPVASASESKTHTPETVVPPPAQTGVASSTSIHSEAERKAPESSQSVASASGSEVRPRSQSVGAPPPRGNINAAPPEAKGIIRSASTGSLSGNTGAESISKEKDKTNTSTIPTEPPSSSSPRPGGGRS